MSILIHIAYPIKGAPWGGGNQFLRGLREGLRASHAYAESVGDADVVLYNASPPVFFERIDEMAELSKSKTLLVRLDGPLVDARGGGKGLDKLTFRIIEQYADGVLYQSEFVRQRSKALGLKYARKEIVCINAPESSIFNAAGRKLNSTSQKVGIIAASWSSNSRKGFDVISYLDQNLDFSRYTLTFVGNCPVELHNATRLPPVSSKELAGLFRENDVFISSSLFEACSNALLEAMHCGCAVVARNNSSNPELVGDAGLLYSGTKDVLKAIDTIARNLNEYRGRIRPLTLDKVVQTYESFAREAFKAKKPRRNATWAKSVIKLRHTWHNRILPRCRRLIPG